MELRARVSKCDLSFGELPKFSDEVTRLRAFCKGRKYYVFVWFIVQWNAVFALKANLKVRQTIKEIPIASLWIHVR